MQHRLQRIAIAPSQIQNQLLTLTSQQHHYLTRVLRLREGDRFIAIDGLGSAWLATLAGMSAQIVECDTVSEFQTELSRAVTLMVALPKGNGFDDVVRSCTELGVACIAPIVSERTLLQPSAQKLERWRRIATEAAEQSERQIVPTILEPVNFDIGLSLISNESFFTKNQQYICVARGDNPHLLASLQQLLNFNQEQKTIVIATGPEGGWTPKEVEQACAFGFGPVSLGCRILRAVTAPIVALSIAAAAFELTL